MRILGIALFITMFMSPSYGLDVSEVTRSSDPHRVKYTGILGAIVDEYESLVTREWYRELRHRYEVGIYNEVNLSLKVKESTLMMSYFRQEAWWIRDWQYSLMSAPREKIIISGPTGDILDLKFARITSKWKFKLKTYETHIAAKYTGLGKMTFGWKFKFSPAIDISIRSPIVRRLGLRFRFIWIQFKKSVIRIDFSIGYRTRRNNFFTEIYASLVQW